MLLDQPGVKTVGQFSPPDQQLLDDCVKQSSFPFLMFLSGSWKTNGEVAGGGLDLFPAGCWASAGVPRPAQYLSEVGKLRPRGYVWPGGLFNPACGLRNKLSKSQIKNVDSLIG